MGRKVNPIAFRLGVNKQWSSNWYIANKRTYAKSVIEDTRIRKFLKAHLYTAGIAEIGIERMGTRIRITIHTSRPGLVIGKKGAEIDMLKKMVGKYTSSEVILVIKEIKRPEINATLVAESIAQQLQRRIAFRRAMKRTVLQALKSGAQGIRVSVSGRLAGADIARTEWYIRGRVPLQTLRADLDYGVAESLTTYGIIGIKVWIFKGEILDNREKQQQDGVASRGVTKHVDAQ